MLQKPGQSVQCPKSETISGSNAQTFLESRSLPNCIKGLVSLVLYPTAPSKQYQFLQKEDIKGLKTFTGSSYLGVEGPRYSSETV